MRIAFAALIALATAASAVSAAAQPANPGPDQPIPGIPGYDQTVIGPDACHAVNPSVAVCAVPAKTSGRYLVVAAGTSTPNGPKPAQALTVGGKTFVCAKATDTSAWTSGPRTLRVECTVTILTDEPLEIGASYQDQDATKDPKGPQIVMQRMPWPGVIDTTGLGAQATAPPAGGETPSSKP